MNLKKGLCKLVKELSVAYLDGKVDGRVYVRVVESLIAFHPKELSMLDPFVEVLARYAPEENSDDFYNDADLIVEVRAILKTPDLT